MTTPAQENAKRFIEELKNLIVVKFELDTEKRTGSIRSEILRDREEKKALFEDPEISELLRNIVGLSKRKLEKIERGEATYEEELWGELENVLQEMVIEVEGLGASE